MLEARACADVEARRDIQLLTRMRENAYIYVGPADCLADRLVLSSMQVEYRDVLLDSLFHLVFRYHSFAVNIYHIANNVIVCIRALV
jgi:hypothetical protein